MWSVSIRAKGLMSCSDEPMLTSGPDSNNPPESQMTIAFRAMPLCSLLGESLVLAHIGSGKSCRDSLVALETITS
jgi:pyocin large subunit-like protein